MLFNVVAQFVCNRFMWDFFSRRQRCDGLLTQQEQFHFSRRLLSIFSQVLINHFGPLCRGFVFLTNCTAHGSQCALQDCCLVGKYHLGGKKRFNGRVRKPLALKSKCRSWARRLPLLTSANKCDGVRSSARGNENHTKQTSSLCDASQLFLYGGKKNTKGNAGCSVGHWRFLLTVQKLYGRISADF